MGTQVTLPVSLPIRFSGTFDYDGFYRFIISWMQKRKLKIFESPFKWKSSGPGLIEIEAAISGEVKIDEYQKFECKVKWKVIDFKYVDVEIQGQKVKRGYGRIAIEFGGKITTDYQDMFGNTHLQATLYKIVQKVLQKDTLKNHIEHFKEELESFHNEAKTYFASETQFT